VMARVELPGADAFAPATRNDRQCDSAGHRRPLRC
jgi:hypothetical protein